MSDKYIYYPNLIQTVESTPSDSIVSRTLYQDVNWKVILFSFSPGQELSEHTASVPAMIQIIKGKCDLSIGEDNYTAEEGAWIHMPTNTRHSIRALTPLYMLLTMKANLE